MGSLNNGQPITQANNTIRFSHNGNYLRKSTTNNNTEAAKISNSGTVRVTNYNYPFGVEFQPGERTFISGLPLTRRDLRTSSAGTGILGTDLAKFVNNSGNLSHVVTRALGIHVSVQDRESANTSSGPMVARTERKVFFLDSDTGKASGLADWNIFNSVGDAVPAYQGTTDIDVDPSGDFNLG